MKPDCESLCMRRSSKLLALCVTGIAISAVSLSAQQNNPYSPRFGMGHQPDVTIVQSSNVDASSAVDDEKCFPWKLSEVRATTVGAKNLNIPSKAKREYEKACDASKKNKFEEAEQHARGAIEKFQDYSAAWVMLGISLKGQQKTQDARDACSHAATIDTTYLPAYLCAAEVSTQDQEWKQVLAAADRALGLKSGGDAYAYYYRATAYLHTNNLADAKKNALQGLQVDVNHEVPTLHLLTAEIYEREGDSANAGAQLRELLKHHPDRQLADQARQALATLESQQPADK